MNLGLQQRMQRFAALALVLSAAVAASAQQECSARGLRAIAFIVGKDGVEHQALCWDARKSAACAPNAGACGDIAPPAAAPAPLAIRNDADALDALLVSAASLRPRTLPQIAALDAADVKLPAGDSTATDRVPHASASAEDGDSVAEQRPVVSATATTTIGSTSGTSQAPASASASASASTTVATGDSSSRGRAGQSAPALVVAGAPVPRLPRGAGEAEVAIQGVYQASTGQHLADTSGVAFKFQNFLQGIGLLSVNFEGYGSQGSFRLGDNYARLSGVSLFGQHWAVSGGDFHAPLALVSNPFHNLFTPELSARGVTVEMSNTHRTLRFFEGRETLTEGPRMPFRVPAPQAVFGASWQERFSDNWQLGVRYLHTTSSASEVAAHPSLFTAGRDFLSSDSVSVQSSLRATKRLRLYGEATASSGDGDDAGKTGKLSYIAGPAWESEKFSARANYIYETNSYLPLAGYFIGDRRGPFADARFRPFKDFEIFGSASRYENNLAHDANLPTFHTASESAGVSATLPWKISASAQFTSIDFNSSAAPGRPASESANQQLALTLSRRVQHHNLRVSLLDLQTRVSGVMTDQRLTEVEDTFTWRRFGFGGAARWQHTTGSQAKNTLFYRATARYNAGRLALYGTIEQGTDLVNRSLFSTNTLQSTVIGANAPLFRGWSLSLEAFRSNLTTDLNPGSIFVLGGQGVPVATLLSSYNQWSVYFRISRQLRWGAASGSETMEQYTARQAPLVGAVEGVVMQELRAGMQTVQGIPVSLDGSRTSFSDATGHYRFIDVPEGVHQVALSRDELPADAEPVGVPFAEIHVTPRGRIRTDFTIAPLTSLTGVVTAPADITLDSLIIRLEPGARYTTPDHDGSFAFYNLREGNYDVVIDRASLPVETLVNGSLRQSVNVQVSPNAPHVEFQIVRDRHEKPVRRILEQQIDLTTGGGAGSGSGSGSGSGQGQGGGGGQ